MRPTVIMYDLFCSAYSGMEKMILSASDVPDSIADQILTGTGSCEPFLLRQIIRIVMDNAVQIGELLFEIGSNVHDFLPYFSTGGMGRSRFHTTSPVDIG